MVMNTNACCLLSTRHPEKPPMLNPDTCDIFKLSGPGWETW